MNKKLIFLMSFLSFLFGCNSNPYHKKNGEWYYDDMPIRENTSSFKVLNNRFARSDSFGFFRGSSISGSDGPSFEALSDQFAKDKLHAYYCDTYRKGQDYFTIKYNDVKIMEAAEPASLQFLDYLYTKDRNHVFFEDKIFPVKDVATFEILKYTFAKDKISAYYNKEAIAGSDGSTFVVLDDHYSKDKNHVYFSNSMPGQSGIPLTHIIKAAAAASFKTFDNSYAADASHAFYEDSVITNEVESFKAMWWGYAKNKEHVFYQGKIISGVDVNSFNTIEAYSDSADAKDAFAVFSKGSKVMK